MNAKQMLTSAKGFSMVEMAAFLTVATLTAGAAAPAVQDYVDQARQNRARQDTHAIAAALSRFEGDVLGQEATAGGWTSFELLVGGGTAPASGSGGDQLWLASSAGTVGALDDQLILNAPGYESRPQRQVNWIRGWHGPYLEAGIGPDPWGHRYAVNAQALATGSGSTVVLSAGANGLVETASGGAVIVPGGDDIIALVATGR